MAKGYVKIENDYFLQLCNFDLSGSEFRVLLFILRQSICYRRPYTKECSYSFIARGTGLSEASVRRAIKKLIRDEYISIDKNASGKNSSSYHLCLVKLGSLGGQVWMRRVVNSDNDTCTKLTTKESKENKSKEIKEERKASPSFSNKKLTLEELAKLSYEYDDEEGEE